MRMTRGSGGNRAALDRGGARPSQPPQRERPGIRVNERKARGFAPETPPRGAAPWNPAKGGAPRLRRGRLLEPFTWSGWTGGGMRCGVRADRRSPIRHGRRSHGPLPSNHSKRMDCKGCARPWALTEAGGPGAKPPGGSRAEPWPSFVHPIALDARPGACRASSGRVDRPYGTDTSHRTILVPLVQPGGLGSCTSSKTPKPPCQGGFRVFRNSTSTPRQSGLPTQEARHADK